MAGLTLLLQHHLLAVTVQPQVSLTGILTAADPGSNAELLQGAGGCLSQYHFSNSFITSCTCNQLLHDR